ncbi:MAG: uracil-DNA glycosylase [Pseudolabrys sp.]
MIPSCENAARELLDFYLEAGVDALVGEAPVNRFAGPDAPPARAEPVKPALRAPEIKSTAAIAPPPAPDTAALAAGAAVKDVTSLDALRAALARFDGCALRATATQLVFADGNPQAKLMLVGEAPGRDEDIEGLPFVGRSGKLLDLMLAAIGLDRASVYIANIIPWRPPGNRTPTPQESQICLPFIRKQIELVDPDILVCLGGPSAATLLGIKEGITKSRGRWIGYHTGKREIRALATFHPAFLLRSPLQKRLAWRDFLAVKKALAGQRG